jgi:Domain of unknown function (DUF4394)
MKRAAVLLFGITLLVATFGASAETFYVATADDRLLRFDTASPESLVSEVALTGLQGDENLVGIDFRPADGRLYALGSTGRLYTLDRGTGALTQVGNPVALVGNRFGLDFNPTVDRLRVVSDQGQNLRLNPDTGALAATDTALAFTTGDANQGDSPVVVGAAYTNNRGGATTTVLYDLELGNGVLVTQVPANNGTLSTVGPLGVTATGGTAAFDISGRTGVAYAVLDSGTGPRLYAVDLASGLALPRGALGGNPGSVTGLAIPASDGPCVPSTTRLCLAKDRFSVSAAWMTSDGMTGAGQAVSLGNDSGSFYFFSPANTEVVLKVVDACVAPFDRFWFFASGLTDVQVVLTVTDTANNTTKTYTNTLGTAFTPILDTNAFDTCP